MRITNEKIHLVSLQQSLNRIASQEKDASLQVKRDVSHAETASR